MSALCGLALLAACLATGRAWGFSGGFIPFPKTAQQRMASGDPRPSLEDRYGTREKYVEKVREAARWLVRDRFLLPEDAGRLVREAEASAVLR